MVLHYCHGFPSIQLSILVFNVWVVMAILAQNQQKESMGVQSQDGVTNFDHSNGRQHHQGVLASSETTCLQEQYLSIRAQRIGPFCCDTVPHLLFMHHLYCDKTNLTRLHPSR